jgi:hypothetical protein
VAVTVESCSGLFEMVYDFLVLSCILESSHSIGIGGVNIGSGMQYLLHD